MFSGFRSLNHKWHTCAWIDFHAYTWLLRQCHKRSSLRQPMKNIYSLWLHQRALCQDKFRPECICVHYLPSIHAFSWCLDGPEWGHKYQLSQYIELIDYHLLESYILPPFDLLHRMDIICVNLMLLVSRLRTLNTSEKEPLPIRSKNSYSVWGSVFFFICTILW